MRFRIAVIVFLFTGAFTAQAQTPDTASVRTLVLDVNGAAVAGATGTLENSATGRSRTAQTDANGKTTFGTVPITGKYVLRVAKSGFAEASRGPFVLRGGETATFRTTLDVAGAAGTVTVFGLTGG